MHNHASAYSALVHKSHTIAHTVHHTCAGKLRRVHRGAPALAAGQRQVLVQCAPLKLCMSAWVTVRSAKQQMFAH